MERSSTSPIPTFYDTSGAIFSWKIGTIHKLTPESWNYTIWPRSHASISFCGYKFGPAYLPEIKYVTADF